MRDLQAFAGNTLNPFNWDNETMQAVFFGDVDAFKSSFSPKDLLARETALRMPAITIAVAGAQRIAEAPTPVDHKRIVELLIEAGSRVQDDGAASQSVSRGTQRSH